MQVIFSRGAMRRRLGLTAAMAVAVMCLTACEEVSSEDEARAAANKLNYNVGGVTQPSDGQYVVEVLFGEGSCSGKVYLGASKKLVANVPESRDAGAKTSPQTAEGGIHVNDDIRPKKAFRHCFSHDPRYGDPPLITNSGSGK